MKHIPKSKYEDRIKNKKQVRMTHLDTLKYQHELAEILRRKCNEPILTDDEKTGLPFLTANALLSQGRRELSITVRGGTFVMGSLHSSILRMVDWANQEILDITQNGIHFKLSMKEVWYYIYQMCIDAYPRALSEALAMSKEMPYRDDVSAYRFNLDSNLEAP